MEFMKNEKHTISLPVIKEEFTAALQSQIARVAKGVCHDWEGNGLHTRLMLQEAHKLVRRKAYSFEELKLDPDRAQDYLAEYPEALERLTFSTPKPLKAAIVDAVEQVILDQVFDRDHKALVLRQWENTRASDILAFVSKAIADYERLTDRVIGFPETIETSADLDALEATVFEIRESFNNENMDYEYLDEVRRADEFLEFFEFVKGGEISADVVLAKDNALGI
jgi:hypothetical protein